MEQPQQLHRASDAVITICQDNEEKNVIVTAISTPEGGLQGFPADKIVGESLAEILPDKIIGMVNDYLEYDDSGNDIAQVLSKIPNFNLLTVEGKAVPCKLKIIRTKGEKGKTWFQLVVHDDVALRKAEQIRSILRENFKGHEVLDPTTGLPDHHSLVRDLELVQHHADNGQITASFALLGIDNYQALLTRHGRANCDLILKQIANLCRRNLRGDDIVGGMHPDKLGVILLDINRSSSRIVLNRLRWLISSQAMELGNEKSAHVTISISFASVGSAAADEVIRQCEASLEALADKQVNTLVEAA